jgi:hypothetical protein
VWLGLALFEAHFMDQWLGIKWPNLRFSEMVHLDPPAKLLKFRIPTPLFKHIFSFLNG